MNGWLQAASATAQCDPSARTHAHLNERGSWLAASHVETNVHSNAGHCVGQFYYGYLTTNKRLCPLTARLIINSLQLNFARKMRHTKLKPDITIRRMSAYL